MEPTRTSFLERFSSKMSSFASQKEGQDSTQNDQDMIEYLLEAGPYVKRYFHSDEQKETSTASNLGGLLVTKNDNRGELYEEYMLRVENYMVPNFVNKHLTDDAETCTKCNKGYVYDNISSCAICPRCGESIAVMEAGRGKGLTYEQEQTSTTTVNFAYKRANHLMEHLACFQAKETTTIPDDVINAVRAELKKQRVTDATKITTKKIKEILKKLRFQKYYEHTQMITHTINGIRPPTIDERTEDRFKALFNEIQVTFDRVCPKTRKNFLSYSYVLHKLSQLLGREDLCPFFPLLKSREKLAQQDAIWKSICKELRYEFVPSL